MVLLELVNGKKGPNDVLIKVYSYGEVLSFSELLFVLKHYFESEGSYYPISEGNKGPAMLLAAICEVCLGRDLDLVLKDYGLNRKRKLSIMDKRERVSESSRVVSSESRLEELM